MGLTYLLAPCGPEPTLQTNNALSESVIFPTEIAILHNDTTVESYYCVPVNSGMVHCSKGVVKRVTLLLRDLADTVSTLWRQG